MVGQDLSERVVQLRPPAPQFSLGKSFPGFGPTGPWLVTPDELANADDLSVSCRLNGELVQSSRTSDLIFSVSTIVEYVSTITPMLPGDLVFTGTPAGVGMGRVPPRYLRPGDVLESTIDQIGTITTQFR
jgi:2,4-didehydro-3-deoxy-L-rhamnonate hydrolase